VFEHLRRLIEYGCGKNIRNGFGAGMHFVYSGKFCALTVMTSLDVSLAS
jgi:hypothetical protein